MDALWLIVLLVLAAGSQLILGPVAVYFTFFQSARPTFREFDLQQPPLPLPTSYFEYIESLKHLRFAAVAHLYGNELSKGTQTCITLFVNRDERATAHVAHMIAPNVPAVTYMEFSTDFEDGSEVNTGNAEELTPYSNAPEKKCYRVPHVKEPKELYRIHQAILATSTRSSSPRLPPLGREVNELCAGMTDTLARQARVGYLYLDESQQKYRATPKGALLMTWKLAWPVAPVRKWRQRVNGKRLVHQLGLTDVG